MTVIARCICRAEGSVASGRQEGKNQNLAQMATRLKRRGALNGFGRRFAFLRIFIAQAIKITSIDVARSKETKAKRKAK